MIFVAGASNTDHKHGQQIIIQLILMSLADKVLLNYAILRDGVFSVFWRIQAYPNGADLLDFHIFGIHELCSMLSGQHPAAIVYTTLDQGIPGVVFVLSLNIDNEADGLAVRWGRSPKAHIIQNGALNSRFVLRIQTRMGFSDNTRLQAAS